jgi:DNA-directed RNA polymerase subunit omega
MARITIEDCKKHINNHFDLINTAKIRATKLAKYAVEPLVRCNDDKATIIALREIAAGFKFDKDGEVIKQEIKNQKNR